jgi:PiT family inorganic phosphate transporter
MATTIATGALKPQVAVTVAALLNFVGAFVSLKVAATVAGGIVDGEVVTPAVIFGGLIGAIAWNLATWWFALAHGTNDAQKTMGVISLALIANGNISGGPDFAVPVWVVIVCAAAIALGTYSGGWRIIQTLGTKVVEVRPPQGFGSEAVAATVILASSHAGYPLSTTQVVSGAVAGSGVGRPGGKVNWAVARRIVCGWLFTLPAAAAVGAIVYGAIDVLGGGGLVVAAISIIRVICAFTLWRANKAKAVEPQQTISERPAFGPAAAVRVGA